MALQVCITLGLILYYAILLNSINPNCPRGSKFGNATSPSTAHVQTVDVFTIVTNPRDYEFLRKGEFWLNFKLMTSLAGKHHLLRLHIFSDKAEVLKQGTVQGYHMHDIRKYSALNDTFMALYRPNHHSINTVEYEYLCFYRWHLFRQAMLDWSQTDEPIKRIVAMDVDIIFSTSVIEFYYKTLETLHFAQNGTRDEDPFDVVVVSPGAVQLFSASGLAAYSEYINQWYSRSYDEVVNATKQVAGYLYGRLHFSDMQMVDAFSRVDIAKRNGCFMTASVASAAERSVDDEALVSALGCIPLASYSAYMKQSAFVFQNGLFYGMNETLPFCFMHFQGDGIKDSMKVFARILLRRYRTDDNHIVKEMLSTPVQIKASTGGDVYQLTSELNKFPLSPLDLRKYKYEPKNVVVLPAEIMNLFPLVTK